APRRRPCEGRRRGRHPDRRHGRGGVQVLAPLHVHRLAAAGEGDDAGGGRHGAEHDRRGGQVQHGDAEADVRGQAAQAHRRVFGGDHADVRRPAPLPWAQGGVHGVPQLADESEGRHGYRWVWAAELPDRSEGANGEGTLLSTVSYS
ncbi:Os10g0424400, partial [Oryza sativa Japonica Group]